MDSALLPSLARRRVCAGERAGFLHLIPGKTVALVLPFLAIACSAERPPEPVEIPVEVVSEFPHDNRAFTQGFLYHEGFFFESTGQYGESSLRRIDPESGRVEQIYYLPDHLFGEGLVRIGDRLYQLTWKAERGFVYDLDTFERKGEFQYEGEGWGLTTDGTSLIVSDGSARLRFYDPRTFELEKTLTVRDHEGEVGDLNELEFVEGEILANRWYLDEIVRISPEDGHVTGVMQLGGVLRPRPRDEDAVLNGIAWDPEKRILYVTGKHWPRVFGLRMGKDTENGETGAP